MMGRRLHDCGGGWGRSRCGLSGWVLYSSFNARSLAHADSPNGAPGSCRHHGAADLVARHLVHEQRHQLLRAVAVLVDLARRGDDVGPAIGLHIVLCDAAPARVEAGNDQHAVGVPLIGRAQEPAKGLRVAALTADA